MAKDNNFLVGVIIVAAVVAGRGVDVLWDTEDATVVESVDSNVLDDNGCVVGGGGGGNVAFGG